MLKIFNRELYRTNVRRSFNSYQNKLPILIEEVSAEISDSLSDFVQSFTNTLIYGCFNLQLLPISKLTNITRAHIIEGSQFDKKECLIFDEENINLNGKRFDLIISNLTLPFINDLPGALIQYNRSLNKNGIFIASLFGPSTLKGIRNIMLDVDLQCFNGAFNHIAPFIDAQDAVALMQRAGFNSPVSGSYMFTYKFDTFKALIKEIRTAGCGNCMIDRVNTYLGRNYFKLIENAFKSSLHNQAEFEIVTVFGIK